MPPPSMTSARPVAKEQGRVMRPDTDSDKGYYYRSDHFEFAKVGVPAYFTRLRPGLHRPARRLCLKLRQAYIEHDYHKVSDEVRP